MAEVLYEWSSNMQNKTVEEAENTGFCNMDIVEEKVSP
jgi:hypothetical protein